MDVDDKKFAQLVVEQDGVLGIEQLVGCGWNYDAIAYRVKRKVWQVLVARVVLTTSGVPTQRQRLRAALLHGGEGSALTAFDACALYQLTAVPPSDTVDAGGVAERAPRSKGFVRIFPTTRPFVSIDRDGLSAVAAPRAVVDA